MFISQPQMQDTITLWLTLALHISSLTSSHLWCATIFECVFVYALVTTWSQVL